MPILFQHGFVRSSSTMPGLWTGKKNGVQLYKEWIKLSQVDKPLSCQTMDKIGTFLIQIGQWINFIHWTGIYLLDKCIHSSYNWAQVDSASGTLRFKINGGGGHVIFFVIFGDPSQLILTSPFINFSNFSRNYTEVHKYIIDSWCFVSVSGSTIY